MRLDVSKAFVRPMVEFPFEVDVQLEPQKINGDTISFDPVHLAGNYRMTDDMVHLEGTLRTMAHAPCALCLAPAQVEVEVEFEENFSKEANEEEEGQFQYEGKQLPLDHMTLTLVLLNLPMRFTCDTACSAAVELKAWNEAETVWAEEAEGTYDAYRPFEGLQQMLDEEQKKK